MTLPRTSGTLNGWARIFIIWLSGWKLRIFIRLHEGEITPVDWKIDRNKLELRRGEVQWGPLDIATRASVVTWTGMIILTGRWAYIWNDRDDLKRARHAGQLTPETEALINTVSLLSKNDSFATVKVKDRGIYYLNNRSPDTRPGSQS